MGRQCKLRCCGSWIFGFFHNNNANFVWLYYKWYLCCNIELWRQTQMTAIVFSLYRNKFNWSSTHVVLGTMHVLYISAHEKDFVFENAGRNQIILQEKTMNSNKIDRKEIQSSGHSSSFCKQFFKRWRRCRCNGYLQCRSWLFRTL